MKTPAKSCLLDPIPTWFIKQNVCMFVPVITRIVNCSLNTGTFPDSLKHAIISPVIKKQSLNPNDLKNYRPVSNITYLSKIIERHAVDNIARYLILIPTLRAITISIQAYTFHWVCIAKAGRTLHANSGVKWRAIDAWVGVEKSWFKHTTDQRPQI